jgi:hypothetical protein
MNVQVFRLSGGVSYCNFNITRPWLFVFMSAHSFDARSASSSVRIRLAVLVIAVLHLAALKETVFAQHHEVRASSGGEVMAMNAAEAPVLLYWSDAGTWSGVKPVAGQDITIPHNWELVLDEDTPALGGITLEGTLRFANANLTLSAAWIMVHGTLRIGSEASPFAHQATINITGADTSVSVMGMGNRGIMVMGGALELHGTPPAIPWTKLNEHAPPGTTTFTLAQNTGWTAGSRIVIGPTDYYTNYVNTGNAVWLTQAFTLAQVSGNQVTTQEASTGYRWGRLQYATTTGMSLTPGTPPEKPIADNDTMITPLVLDERAPVGNLTRNIVIQAPDDALWQQLGFGVHIMIMGSGAQAHVDGVEIRRGGQRRRLARYPFHWHMLSYSGTQTLADATGQYFRNSVVHESANRGLVIHGTNGVTVQNNVFYNITGHGIFFEDGVERRNTIDGNLVLRVRAPATGQQLKMHETGEQGPSGMWISNPDNIIINNHVADARGHGFWLAYPLQPFGQSSQVLHSDGQLMRPNRLLFGRFDNNTSHSNGFDGVHLDDPEIDEEGNTFPHQYQSTTNGRPVTGPGTMRRFSISRFNLFKNMRRGFWDRATWTDIYGGVSADNNGRYFAGSGADGLIQRNLVIGTSLNSGTNGFTRTPRIESFTGPMDLATPTAFATYHSTFDIRNNILINFPAIANTRSGVFASEDYYIRAVDKGHLRNTGNLLIASHYGIKLPPIFSYYTLAGALWDPHNAWGGTGINNYFVYDTPFFTYGQTPHIVQPAGGVGGVLVNGPFYGFNDFVVNNANDSQADLMALRVTRYNQAMDSVGGMNLTQAGDASWILAHMRHFAAHPSGIYKLEFPTIDNVQDVHFAVENMLTASDSLILAVEYSGSMRVSQVYASSHWLWRNQSVAEWPSNFWGKTIFTPAGSREAVFASSAQGAFWHDVENNLVWMKMRGGLSMAWEGNGGGTPDQFAETSDEKLYREFGIRIYGTPKTPGTISGQAGYHLLANPYTNDRPADWLAPIWTQGAEGSDAPDASPNIFRYNDGETLQQKTWQPVTNLNGNTVSGEGLAVYVFQDDDYTESPVPGQFPKTLYSLGTLPAYPFSVPVVYRNTGNPDSDGWNLVGNPDTRTVSWAVDFTRTNVDNVAYRWNNTTSSWQATDGQTLNPSAGGIPAFEGFFVKANASNPVLHYQAAPAKQERDVSTPSIVEIHLRAGTFHASAQVEMYPLEARLPSDALSLSPLSTAGGSLTLLDWKEVVEQPDIRYYLRKSLHRPQESRQFEALALFSDADEHTVTIIKKNFTGTDKLLFIQNSELEVSDSLTFVLDTRGLHKKRQKAEPTFEISSASAVFTQLGVFTIVPGASAVNNTADSPLPAAFALHPAHPNPFNPATQLRFSLPETAYVSLEVFDISGRKVASLLRERRGAGNHAVSFNAAGLSSGVYIVLLHANSKTVHQKITVLK